MVTSKKHADTMPCCNEAFTLKRYKEIFDRTCSEIALFLCSCSDELTGIFNDFDSASMEQERPGSLSSSLYATPPVVIPGNNQPNLNMQVQQPLPSTSKEVQ